MFESKIVQPYIFNDDIMINKKDISLIVIYMQILKRMDNYDFYTCVCISTYLLILIKTINKNAFTST